MTSVVVVGETTLLGTFDRTVAVDGETVRSMAVDRDEEFWAAEFDERVNDVLEVNGTVYVAAAEGLVGLHPDTGERRWVVAPDGGSSRWGYLGLGDGRLHWITRASYRRYRPNGPERPQKDAAASLSELEPQFDPGPPVIAAGRAYSGGVGPNPTGVREFSRGGVSWYRRYRRRLRRAPVATRATPGTGRLRGCPDWRAGDRRDR